MRDNKLKLRHGRRSAKYVSHAIYSKHTHTHKYVCVCIYIYLYIYLFIYIYTFSTFYTMPVEVYFSRNRDSLSEGLITKLIGPLSSVDKILSCERIELDQIWAVLYSDIFVRTASTYEVYMKFNCSFLYKQFTLSWPSFKFSFHCLKLFVQLLE
jgi:hypothetical protein